MLNVTCIRDRATALKLSDSALASACNVSPETLSQWIAGESLPRPRSLKALAQALRIEVDTLVNCEDHSSVFWFGALAQLCVMDRERAELRGEDMNHQLRTLRHYLEKLPVSSSPACPSTDNPGLTALRELVQRHLQEGHILVPVRWDAPLQAYAVAVVRHQDAVFVYVNVRQGLQLVTDALARALEDSGTPGKKGFAHIEGNLSGATDAGWPRTTGGATLDNVAHAIFVAEAEQLFETPIFRALAAYQRAEGGRDAAFISSVLGIHIFEAYKLSQVLNQN